MNSRTKTILLAALTMAWLTLAFSPRARAEVPVIGEMAPAFTLQSQDGSPVSLSDFLGHWVVVYFYTKDECASCALEARNFQRDLPQYQRDRAVVVGISPDTPAAHKSFCEKQGVSFKLLSDPSGKVAHSYGSLHSLLGVKYGTRNTFLIDPDGRIFQVWTGTKPARQSGQVLSRLDHLQFP
jgi:peroxiredoxin Q/BCP